MSMEDVSHSASAAHPAALSLRASMQSFAIMRRRVPPSVWRPASAGRRVSTPAKFPAKAVLWFASPRMACNDAGTHARKQNPMDNNAKTHPDIARHKAGEGWVLRRPKGAGKDQNDLRRRSRSGIEGAPSTALFGTANGRIKKGKRVTLFRKSNSRSGLENG